MNTVKTNRSAALYTVLTILRRVLPVIIMLFTFRGLFSVIGDLMKASDMLKDLGELGSMFGYGGMGDISMRDLDDIIEFSGLGGIELGNAWADTLVIAILVIDAVIVAYWIYEVVLFSFVFRDANTTCENCGAGKKSLPYIVVAILSAVTLNIYNIVWSRQQGKRLEEAAARYQKNIRGSAGSHTVFAVLYALSVWITLAMELSWFFQPFFFLTHLRLLLILMIVCFVLKFMMIGNMSAFIRDVNVLDEAYYGYSGDYAVHEQIPDGGTEDEAGMQHMGDDDSVTVAAGSWANGYVQPQGGTGGSMQCCAGLYEGSVIPLDGTELVIGRDETSANLVIKDPKVSRKHCGVRYNGDGSYTVTDYSTNGVFYKGGPMLERNVPTVCMPGTVIVIAESGNEFLLN